MNTASYESISRLAIIFVFIFRNSYNAGQKLWQKPENPAKTYTTTSIFIAFRITLPPSPSVKAHWLSITLKTTLELGEGEILNKHL